jgi:hypothetical protein
VSFDVIVAGDYLEQVDTLTGTYAFALKDDLVSIGSTTEKIGSDISAAMGKVGAAFDLSDAKAKWSANVEQMSKRVDQGNAEILANEKAFKETYAQLWADGDAKIEKSKGQHDARMHLENTAAKDDALAAAKAQIEGGALGRGSRLLGSLMLGLSFAPGQSTRRSSR